MVGGMAVGKGFGKGVIGACVQQALNIPVRVRSVRLSVMRPNSVFTLTGRLCGRAGGVTLSPILTPGVPVGV